MKNKKIIFISFIIICILFGILYFKNEPKYIDQNLYQSLLNQNLIQKAVIDKDEIWLKTSAENYVIIKEGVDIKELLEKVPVENKQDNTLWVFFILFIFIITLLLSLGYFARKKEIAKYPILNKNQNPSANTNLENSNIKSVISNITFNDVAGVDEVKMELSELVDFLQNPRKYKEFGVKMPKGVLMVGPPGVGKTLIAKAVAGEAGVPFFYQSGSSFVEIYVGMGAKRVRELFSKAKMMAPSIVFIDEIDAVGKARGEMSNVERDSTLNQLLTQMDGFEDNSGVIVIAATNKIELMDPALLRSGRFDRRIFLSLPDFKDRLKILEIYMKDKNNNVNLNKIAKVSVGFSGAGLETLVNEAAINALRRNSTLVEESDFYAVLNKVLLGKKKILSFNDEEKKIQATYQAAKALSAYYFDIGFEKITLIEDRFKEYEYNIRSKSELINRIKVYLSGSRAMKLIYNETYTNSQNDFLKVKELLEYMISFDMLEESNLNQQKKETDEFLHSMKDKILKLSEILLEKEKLEYCDVKNIMQV
ncbi:ATP-dependent metallopeptidase FtsH/Yme1/Tma family protein [Campylobacter hepaticus]|uniref:AAA family ATPase n=2 Tax=Campylobacter hepaticus TaxID=1813019 RepID=A0A6A7JU23_9BACT|nr:ATP-dependent metallopeptidase FtsH/Yme1/Tma family protein [Campylobacter hepaticus]AXP08495.1 ATP-dependent metallopeptidase FtsH/Yme1/Tma family protein [Campylobacter hepaticus]MCZ0772331.1 ATP-dependent metallopeptidase FtsH/Yme1/Tma family protein [Campylobacter hepaticus]MCZ0773799.1 ATP-dependent metallopeptidase FtsH/Yme1/Tma family protein [Campylobacter hepaticus]MCZ0775050.1 ATP-dependent metallopeptidase FtsH/Yme1/Tma family protein [Campylobacter hepaticus]MDX2322919.1 ATP-dep